VAANTSAAPQVASSNLDTVVNSVLQQTADANTETEDVPAVEDEERPEGIRLQSNEGPRDEAKLYPNPHAHPPRQAHLQLKRDANGKLRAFTTEGIEYKGADWEQRMQQEVAAMEDLTQKSSMSLTQENSASVYDHFDIQTAIREDCPSAATPNAVAAHYSARQHASAKTQSTTTHTYQENDAGHITLDYNPFSAADIEDNESQDGSYPTVQNALRRSSGYEPETPAAPVNPFFQKGSVLKMADMFGATQPSSVGHRMNSPTSSRPSPDVYNDFSSPPKRQRILSSPLGGQALNDTSPLQSSVRNLLVLVESTDSPQVTLPRTSGVQSFDAGPRNQRTQSLNEPRAYVSMK